MKRLFLAAAAAAALLSGGSAASAAQFMTLTPPEMDGSISGTFGNTGIDGGAFNNIFNFNLPTGFSSFTASSSFTNNPMNDINFTSIAFNGTNFNIGSTGQVEFRFLTGAAETAGPQQLAVNGTSGDDTFVLDPSGASAVLTVGGETTTLTGVENLVLNGGSGADSFDINDVSTVPDLHSILINGGSGTDVVDSTDLPAGSVNLAFDQDGLGAMVALVPGAAGGDGNPDTLVLSRNGELVEFRVNGTLTFSGNIGTLGISYHASSRAASELAITSGLPSLLKSAMLTA